MKNNKYIVTVFLLAVSVGCVYGARLMSGYGREPEGQSARSKGHSGAPVRVIEYTDFQCPACRRGAETLEEFASAHPEKFYVEHRHYPLKMHRHALAASIFAECAARQDKFWAFHHLVFERQPLWADRSNPRPIFMEIADETGLDKERLAQCVLREDIEETVKEDKEKGRALGVRSTPTFFINEEMVVGSMSLKKKLKEIFP